jgi:chromosome segregation ATPase
MPRPPLAALLAGAAAALLPATPLAQAPSAEARLREALRAATVQVRALEDERAAWQAKEAALQKEVEALKAKVVAPAPRPQVGARELAELRGQVAQQAEAAARAAASLERCEAERGDAARAREEERSRLQAQAARVAEQLAAAEGKNERIYRVAKETLDWLQREGVGGEPFLGLRRVALENAVQDREDRLVEQRIKAPGAP